jgi:hypothetical protein
MGRAGNLFDAIVYYLSNPLKEFDTRLPEMLSCLT